MWLREELLKSIWHAFTALDVDHRGKVSKSQLKVRFTVTFRSNFNNSLHVEQEVKCFLHRSVQHPAFSAGHRTVVIRLILGWSQLHQHTYQKVLLLYKRLTTVGGGSSLIFSTTTTTSSFIYSIVDLLAFRLD